MNLKLTMSAEPKVLAQVLIILAENHHRIDRPNAEMQELIDEFNRKPDTKADAPKPKEAQKATTKAVSKTEASVKAEEPAFISENSEESTEDKKPVSLETIRIAVQEKAMAGHKTAIIALLKSFGAETVPKLKKDDYPSFYTKVCAL
ncbi:MAG: hypothetical protein M9898_02070 [Chitinophagaceae bacterium]|nr:hypothetical protein [Chitinophagaceae bacterium]